MYHRVYAEQSAKCPTAQYAKWSAPAGFQLGMLDDGSVCIVPEQLQQVRGQRRCAEPGDWPMHTVVQEAHLRGTGQCWYVRSETR